MLVEAWPDDARGWADAGPGSAAVELEWPAAVPGWAHVAAWPDVEPDSVVVAPDWAVVAPDWAVVAPDWAVVAPDWAVVAPDWADVAPDWAVAAGCDESIPPVARSRRRRRH